MAKPIPEMPSSVFVALVGRPNVGKSSLTNYLVGEKVAIVTKKPQTTRSRITGVITKGPVQYVLMDTPGIHAARNKLDARMTQTAAASLKDVDVTMMLFEPAGEFTDAELTMVKALQKLDKPTRKALSDTLKLLVRSGARSVLEELGVNRLRENRLIEALSGYLETRSRA